LGHRRHRLIKPRADFTTKALRTQRKQLTTKHYLRQNANKKTGKTQIQCYERQKAFEATDFPVGIPLGHRRHRLKQNPEINETTNCTKKNTNYLKAKGRKI